MRTFTLSLSATLAAALSLLVACSGGDGQTGTLGGGPTPGPGPTGQDPGPGMPPTSPSDAGVVVLPDGAIVPGPPPGGGGSSSAAALAAKLGLPKRLAVGTGGGAETADLKSQGIKTDIHERYLVGVGSGSWPDWNSPSGAYVNVVASDADSLGAVPMFTLYQMAQNGDGNLADLTDTTFMTQYWASVKLLFQRLAIYDKPALVNLEPDFWGYAERQAPGSDPTKLAASVTSAPDCAGLSNDVVGLGHCMITLARKYAPKAYIGFPPSTWGGDAQADVIAFMKKVGAGEGDFVTMQTLDRDAGCFEAAKEGDCMRGGTGWYWDETNATHPNFQDHLAEAKAYYDGLSRPLIWWQTPFGVPSSSFGTTNHYRDNRVHYFLTHPDQLVAAGGLGVVFGAGSGDVTTITTDNGQFKTMSAAYYAHPAALP